MILLGSCLLILSQIKDYTLLVDDNEIRIKALAFRASQLFELANIELEESDRISTDPDAFRLNLPSHISLRTARNVLVRTPKKDHVYRNAELFPANLLAQAGIKLFPHDLILLDDKVIAQDQLLPSGLDVVLEYIPPAKRIDLYTNGKLFTSILRKP